MISPTRTAFVLLGSALALGGCSDSGRSSGRGSTSAASTSATRFEIRIENVSDGESFSSPLSPGVFAVHDSRASLFTAGWADRGAGLESLAEDGNPTELAGNLALATGVTASGEIGATPPGTTTTFTVDASPNAPLLSLATMLVQSNDLFLAGDQAGLSLFDSSGAPIPQRTITLDLWDAGTEVNEVPGAGPNQPVRQGAPNTGPAEGVIAPSSHGTRSLPAAGSIARVSVTESGGTFTFTVENVGASQGSLVTPLAPVFWAIHDDTYALFRDGQQAPNNGLETLAEDGSPMGLVGAASADPAVASTGAQTTTLERPTDPPGPAGPGERFRFSVTPDVANRRVSLACMIVESNDAFVAFGEDGIELLDATGAVRPLAEIRDDMQRTLATWDAGTELNETPGAGPNQPMRQAGPNTGAPDADATVRRYAESASDVGPAQIQVAVVRGAAAGSFDVTVTNTSAMSGAMGVLTPVAWAVHSSSVRAFEPGQPASAGLETLAEDGSPAGLVGELTAAGALSAGAANTPVGSATPGPITPGGSYTFSVVADAQNPYLSLATMLVPTNDTFYAFPSMGLRLVNADGSSRSDAELAFDVAAGLQAWDAGTEANEIGFAGPNQPPRQPDANTGPAEGDGTVRLFNDPVHTYPSTDRIVTVTIRPLP